MLLEVEFPHYLIEYGLCDFNVRCLVFHNHACRQIPAIEHCITPLGSAVQLYHYFIGKKGGRISFVCNKKVNKVLTYPFFGGKRDISFANHVENYIFSVSYVYFSVEYW